MQPLEGHPNYGQDFHALAVHMSSTGQLLQVLFDGEGVMVLESKEALGRELMQSRPGDKC